MRTPILPERPLAVLRTATTTATTITLPPGPPVPRWVWHQLNATCHLLGGGGRWDPHQRGWVFDRDPRPDLAAFLAFQDRPDVHQIRRDGRVGVLAGATNPNVHCEIDTPGGLS